MHKFAKKKQKLTKILRTLCKIVHRLEKKYTTAGANMTNMTNINYAYITKTLPKAQRTRGLSSYHKLDSNLDQTDMNELK